jgi:hypothetical protein
VVYPTKEGIMSPSKHQEILIKAAQLFDNGYSPTYIYEKLLKDGISPDEAKAAVEGFTNKEFLVPAPAAEGQAPAPIERQEASTGGLTLAHYLIGGLLIIGFGLILTFALPDMRWLGFAILLAGPVVILFGAFRARS